MSGSRKTLAGAGELEFIQQIRLFMPEAGGAIVRSVGDDCFVVRPAGDTLLAVTTDTFVDGIHFARDYSTWREIGARCMAASVSDIAAMSGLPAWSALSLAMPAGMFLDEAVELFAGLAETAAAYGSPITGGETVSTPGPLTVTVTVLGNVGPDRMVTRAGARPGDGIYLTGSLGDAMAGLLAFQTGETGFDGLKRRFLRPEAQVAFSRRLTEHFRVNAMIDLSDGLASDLRHICEESGCGAEVWADMLPLSAEFRELMARRGKNPLEFALGAGEDYGLLFTTDDPAFEAGILFDTAVTRIGTITARRGNLLLVSGNGNVEPISSKGYEHFTV